MMCFFSGNKFSLSTVDVYVQYVSPRVIHVLENASVGHNVTYVRACHNDTQSTIYYILLGMNMTLHSYDNVGVVLTAWVKLFYAGPG